MLEGVASSVEKEEKEVWRVFPQAAVGFAALCFHPLCIALAIYKCCCLFAAFIKPRPLNAPVCPSSPFSLQSPCVALEWDITCQPVDCV